MLACPPNQDETSATLQGVGPLTRHPITPQNITKGGQGMGHT